MLHQKNQFVFQKLGNHTWTISICLIGGTWRKPLPGPAQTASVRISIWGPYGPQNETAIMQIMHELV